MAPSPRFAHPGKSGKDDCKVWSAGPSNLSRFQVGVTASSACHSDLPVLLRLKQKRNKTIWNWCLIYAHVHNFFVIIMQVGAPRASSPKRLGSAPDPIRVVLNCSQQAARRLSVCNTAKISSAGVCSMRLPLFTATAGKRLHL